MTMDGVASGLGPFWRCDCGLSSQWLWVWLWPQPSLVAVTAAAAAIAMSVMVVATMITLTDQEARRHQTSREEEKTQQDTPRPHGLSVVTYERPVDIKRLQRTAGSGRQRRVGMRSDGRHIQKRRTRMEEKRGQGGGGSTAEAVGMHMVKRRQTPKKLRANLWKHTEKCPTSMSLA